MKLTLSLPPGAFLVIEGEPRELADLFKKNVARAPSLRAKSPSAEFKTSVSRTHSIVDAIESRSDWSKVELKIMSKQLPRVLLCLEAAAQSDDPWLTSKEIEEITDGLGAIVAAANVAKAIRTGGKGLIHADKSAVARFKIKARGSQALAKFLQN